MKLLKHLIQALPFLYMIFVFILSSLPSDAIIDTDFSFDRAFKESLHLIEFAILYGFWVLTFLVSGKLTDKTSLLAAALSILYGLSDEIHQSFVPYRSATVIDFVKDTIGVLVFYFLIKRTYLAGKDSRFTRAMRKMEGIFAHSMKKG